jgi:glycine oxidase
MKNNSKTLIAGGGLAGICLAYQLYKNNKPFLLVDKGVNHSSSIAAGLINPMVFRRMLKSWRLDDFLPNAIEFYHYVGKLLSKEFLHFIPLRRGFAHEQEKELWIERQNLNEYNSYLSEITPSDLTNSSIINTYGTGIVKKSGYVDTQELLSSSHAFFKSINSMITESYSYNDFDIQQLTYKGQSFDNFIFCEGYHNLENPWFNYLPLQATKGQTLTIRSTELNNKEIANRKCFILPIKNNEFKVGATYEWNETDLSITQEGLNILKQNINQLVDKPYEVLHQEAGVRPTVKDRRPLLGEHPSFKNVFIFNGLGTKGYLMAPLLSQELYEFIFEGALLDKEVNINRCK